jgi:predicted metal-dependent peptidase
MIKNIHEKLMESVQQMLIDTKVNLPYYGNFNLFISFSERKDIGTCAVNMTAEGMNFYYNSEFLNRLSQKEVNFITLHEDFHLLWNHPKRTITGQYDHKLSNVAQDMIINHIIWEDIPATYVEIPKDENGKNMTLFVPKEYPGKLIFEELYEWLRDQKEKREKEKECKSCSGSGKKDKGSGKDKEENDQNGDQNGDGSGQNQDGEEDCEDCNGSGKQSSQKKYGPYGKNPKNESETIDTWSLDDILDNLDKNNGQYMDVHMGDEVPEEMRESMVKDAMERLQARGLESGKVEQTLNKLRKKRKNYLSYIKRTITNLIMGTNKNKTIVKPNRRQVEGLKGNRKTKTAINVILDTSGSMGNTFEKVLSYIYRGDISVNMIQADTEVKWVDKFMDKKKIERMKISGLGGTQLMPGILYVEQHFNKFNTVILTDGYCDNLDISRLSGKVLIISIGVEVPISKSNGKLKQIVVDLNND